MTKTWFITGASRGFGREFTKAALARGDRVAATARDTSSLDDLRAEHGDALLPLQLDVTDRAADREAVARAAQELGRLDVVVNNAGYGHFGAVEELSEADLREQMEANLFGAVWVTQAALPVMRAQGSGHIIQITSVGGIAAFPGIGAYHASKWALEGLTESLSQEVAGQGIKVTLVEPGGFSTDWSGASAHHSEEMPEYQPVRDATRERYSTATPGDPVAAAQALLRVVDAEEPPLRVLFGSGPTTAVPELYAKRLETWKQWEGVSRQAQGS
ncbi:SDR family oxidoreductase [Streptomyces sp. NP160]|uniref:SDR family oxidoreductase n=1 Tax=Streptomyces sp. NP160 TaxID=2586637 RepID=UPI0011191E07|nr:SDR family oxidoreductase [Streptomyces sp. NP160]TNM59273.1 SDR family oxidoreductase [Streptomyces sp. NP160]